MQNDSAQYRQWITEDAGAAGVPVDLALKLATQESGIRQYDHAGNVLRSSEGALGIMQVLPSTAPGVDLADPRKNIRCGVGYLSSLHAQFHTWPVAAAAYNAGTRRVLAWLAGEEHRLPGETVAYVKAITGVAPSDQAGREYILANDLPRHPALSPPREMTQGQAIGLGLVAAGVVLYVLLR